MAFTYTLGTNLGRVRLLIPDTDSTAAVFQDDELNELLSLSEGSIYEATAKAYEIIARDRTRKLARWTEDDVTEAYYSASDLLEMARAIRQSAMNGKIQTVEITGDDYLDTFRPLWRDFMDRTLE
jgi:hypothetical protein